MHWITYARPFAKRIRVYRMKIAQREARGDYEYAFRAEDYILVVKRTWCEFRDQILQTVDETHT